MQSFDGGCFALKDAKRVIFGTYSTKKTRFRGFIIKNPPVKMLDI